MPGFASPQCLRERAAIPRRGRRRRRSTARGSASPLGVALLATAALLVAVPAREARAQTRDGEGNGSGGPQVPATREERDREARAEFNAGREAFSRGNYEEAARRFERAYFLSSRAQLYYNIGTTYDRLHRWVEARDAFQRYLQAFPEAMERDEIRARLTVIESEIRREREARANGGVIVRERVIVRPAIVEPPHPWRYVAIGAGGLAVVVGAVAGGLALAAAGFYDSNLRECGDQSAQWMMNPAFSGCPASVISDLELRATLINVFIGGAAGLAALAVVSAIVDATTTARPAHAAPPADGARARGARRGRGGADPWMLRATVAPVLGGGAGAPGLAAGALTGGMLVVSGAL